MTINTFLEPYIGPRPFGTDIKDRLRFFGRDVETDEILALITSHRVILVYAQSGAGKTSIFNAQIIPSLQEDYGFEVLPMARVKITSTIPTSPKDINNNISSQIKNIYIYNAMQVLKPEIDPQSIRDLYLFEFLDKYFPTQKEENGEMRPQVLIFDQFEELFSLYTDRWIEQQKDFFQQITDSLDNNPLIRIVFIIREDFLGQLDPFRSILPEKLSPHFRLERLRRKEAILAIKSPLTNIIKSLSEDERKNIESEINALVNDLLKINVEIPDGKIQQLEGEFIEPIQLQVVCKRWWHERNTSKKVGLEDLGNVGEALEDFYEDAILSTSKQTIAREKDIRIWCEEELITSSGTRSIVHRGHNSTGGIDNKVVDSLESEYLVRREWRAGASWYELTHDRLIKPIKDSNKEWFDKKQKSQKAFRIKVFVPILLISIISISLYIFNLQTDIQEQQQKFGQLTNGINAYGQGHYSQALKEFDKVLDSTPNNTEALFYKALTLENLGNLMEALENYEKVLSIDSTYVKAIYNKGDVLYDLHRYDEALKNYEKYIEIYPTDLAALYSKGSVLSVLGKYEEAITWYDKVLAINSTDVDALYGKGSAFDDLGKYEEAITWYDKVLAIDSTDVDALNTKGVALDNLGKYQEAITWYDKALAIDPKYVDALNNKGVALDNLGKYEEAITWFDKALAIDSTYVIALNNKGVALDNLGKYEEAITWYDKVLAINSTDVDAITGKGNVLYSLGKYNESITWYDKALAINPRNEFTLYSIGYSLYDLGKYNESITWFDKALEINPKFASAISGKGIVLNSLGKYNESITWFDKALAIDSTDVDAISGKGNVLYKLGKYNESNTWYDKALAINPRNVYELYSIGYSLYDLGKYNESITWFDKALEINPKFVSAISGKGDALYSIGKYNESITWYDKALEINPKFASAISGKGDALIESQRRGH